MSGWDKPVGSTLASPVSAVAAKCADRIMEYAGPRAVTLDPDGNVWLERPENAAELDLVGVYQRDQGLLLLTRDIRDDLLHEKQTRKLEPRKRPAVRSDRAKRAAREWA